MSIASLDSQSSTDSSEDFQLLVKQEIPPFSEFHKIEVVNTLALMAKTLSQRDLPLAEEYQALCEELAQLSPE